jgi:cation transport regulator ChaC
VWDAQPVAEAVDEPTLWYFAYGSNLDADTFLGRRRMRPCEMRVGVLQRFELRFDLPVGPGERGVANVAAHESDEVWGALYRLTHAEAERLDRTEGVPFGAYRRLDVAVRDASGALVTAFTYQSSRGVADRKPSRRYLGLLLAGARWHGLPAPWIERLRALPLAVDERDSQLPLFTG